MKFVISFQEVRVKEYTVECDDEDNLEFIADEIDVVFDDRDVVHFGYEVYEIETCNTCDGTGQWESTTEDSPTTLINLGACPECVIDKED